MKLGFVIYIKPNVVSYTLDSNLCIYIFSFQLFNMKKIIKILIRFFSGFGSIYIANSLPYKKYPFTFPEKSLTSDWILIGKDIQKSIDKATNDRK